MFIYVALNTTYCEPTAENWREFPRLKAAIVGGGTVTKPANIGEFKLALQKQIASENNRLRLLRAHLPGLSDSRFIRQNGEGNRCVSDHDYNPTLVSPVDPARQRETPAKHCRHEKALSRRG